MKNIILLFMVIALIFISGCKKYLDEKSDRKLVVPSSLVDLQSILDNYSKNVFSDLGSGEVSTNDYYLTDANYNGLSLETFRRMYTWQKGNLFEPASNEWTYGYYSIYAANSVIEGIEKVKMDNPNVNEVNDIKGQAFYLRAKTFLSMVFIWAQAYDHESAKTDLGLPLRLNTDFNERSKRATLKATYDQIISDLKTAVQMLPVKPHHPIRASKAAAFALLARTYLSMRQYKEAGENANACLKLSNKLIDYSSLNETSAYPIEQFNDETIIFSVIPTPTPLNPSRAKIDPELYALYAENDLRRTVFFRRNSNGSYAFKGNYTGNLAPFGGIATDEIYLIRAEAAARDNNINDAMKDLNHLLLHRWKKDAMTGKTLYVDEVALNQEDAIHKILVERRKELLLRGLRWMDIKRLNKAGANITLKRTVNNSSFTLLPNDLRYALAIPEDVIELSGIEQNP